MRMANIVNNGANKVGQVNNSGDSTPAQNWDINSCIKWISIADKDKYDFSCVLHHLNAF